MLHPVATAFDAGGVLRVAVLAALFGLLLLDPREFEYETLGADASELAVLVAARAQERAYHANSAT